MDTPQARTQLVKPVAKRLGITDAAATALVNAYLSALLEAGVHTTATADQPPTTLPATRALLIEKLVAELQRVPSAVEVAALLRIPVTTSRSLINQVLAVSDQAQDVALVSVFQRATQTGTVGGQATIPHGKLWRFTTSPDLVLAKRELERKGIKHVTQNSTDGNYVLVIDPAFAP